MFSEFDRLAMTRALALAERGLETTHPNPRVGCVLAKGERIIAEGWHERAGEAHAEVAALRAAKEPVAGATAYVTLEPCSHYGRTPPCVNALIEARIARVVFAVQDPNPRVSGQGADALLRAGIAVEAGLMEAEATEINIGFMKRMKHGLPWVRVKLAMSLDGRTALANGASQWITGEHARNDVQRWRARCSAVMTGVGTVLADDPQLNVRTVGFKGRQPLRVVLDSWLRSPPGAKMFVGLGAAAGTAAIGGGDVLIFTAAGGGVPTANPAFSAALTEPADLADDMAALVNAFETSPTAVAARAADVAGPASMKTSAKTDAPAQVGAARAPPVGVSGTSAAKSTVGPAAGSSPDDATWAGAALSGAVPVGQRLPKAPAVAAGAPLSGPGPASVAVRDSTGQGASTFSGVSTMPKPIPVVPASPVPAASGTTQATVAAAAPAPTAPAAAVGASAAPDAERAAAAPVLAGTGAALVSEPAAAAPADKKSVAKPTAGPAGVTAGGSVPTPADMASAAKPTTGPTGVTAGGSVPTPADTASAAKPTTGPARVPAAGSAAAPGFAADRPPGGAAVAGGSASAAPVSTSPKPDSPTAFKARRAALTARGVRIEEVPADDGLLDLLAVLQKLAEIDVNEVLVEAGPTLAGQLLTTFLVDELLLYIAPKLLGPQGRPLVNLPELQSLQDAWGFALFDAKRFGDDLRLRLRPK